VTSVLEQVAHVEAGLVRTSKRMPDLPVTEILLSKLLVFLGRELTGRMDACLRPYGLIDIEFRALMLLYSAPNSTANPGELCNGIIQSPANITRITDVLVERGLISRLPDEQDRRRLVLKITAQGETLLNEVLPVMLSTARNGYRDFPNEELNQVVASLKRLAAALDRISLPNQPSGQSNDLATNIPSEPGSGSASSGK
jgi:MarR family transcriptional repressor of emrRAB